MASTRTDGGLGRAVGFGNGGATPPPSRIKAAAAAHRGVGLLLPGAAYPTVMRGRRLRREHVAAMINEAEGGLELDVRLDKYASSRSAPTPRAGRPDAAVSVGGDEQDRERMGPGDRGVQRRGALTAGRT